MGADVIRVERPAARIGTLAVALAHPQVADSVAWKPLDVPQLGMSVRAPALLFDAPWAPAVLRPAPGQDEHRSEILAELHREATA